MPMGPIHKNYTCGARKRLVCSCLFVEASKSHHALQTLCTPGGIDLFEHGSSCAMQITAVYMGGREVFQE